ncbi:hypothetical protein MHYP_G00231890 [Metynnis hypsauchen]
MHKYWHRSCQARQSNSFSVQPTKDLTALTYSIVSLFVKTGPVVLTSCLFVSPNITTSWNYEPTVMIQGKVLRAKKGEQSERPHYPRPYRSCLPSPPRKLLHLTLRNYPPLAHNSYHSDRPFDPSRSLTL